MKKEFDKNDVDLLEEAVNLLPEIRLCALALKQSRRLKVAYPIKNHKGLNELLDGEKIIKKGRHSFSPPHIKHYVTKEQFPINNEADLASAVYLGLCRCNEDMKWAAKAPKNAKELMEITEKMGE